MQQHLGLWNLSNIPSWFSEGLAVYVSDGAGAEGVDREAAKKAIISGNSFTPVGTGSLLFPKGANYFGLKPGMFYKQAGLFVAWLCEQNKNYFKTLISSIQSRETLEEAMFISYGVSVLENWESFTNEQKI